MSSRYFVTHQSAVYSCGLVTMTITTNTAMHLWLLSTFKHPFVRPIPFRGQQSAVPHQNNMSLEIQRVTEQEEPGNTTTHTFVFPWPAGAQILWMYTINQGTGGLKATRSPLFAYSLRQEPLLDEKWLHGLTGTYDWQYQATQPGSTFNAYPGQLIYTGGIGFSGSATFDVSPASVLGQTPACDLYLRLSAYATSASINTFVGISFQLQNATHTNQQIFDVMYRVNPLDPGADGTIHGYYQDNGIQNPELGLALGDAFYHPVFPSPVTPIPYDPAFITAFTIFTDSGGNPPASQAVRVVFNTLLIASAAGQLTDVSGEWRKLRLAPFLP